MTGDNWYEITASSDFMRRPGPLVASVRRYVKVVTDERDACRRRDAAGACVESDYIFSLAEQYQPIIDGYPLLANVQVAAGHVAIVGYKGVAPRLLVSTWLASWTGDIQTTLRWELEPARQGTLLRLRHSGLAAHPELSQSYRGWPRMLGWLQAFLERGETVHDRPPANW